MYDIRLVFGIRQHLKQVVLLNKKRTRKRKKKKKGPTVGEATAKPKAKLRAYYDRHDNLQ